MSQNNFDDQSEDNRFTRRHFVQSTALLTGLSVTGKQLIDPSPAEAQQSVSDLNLAQVPPAPAVTAPAAPPQPQPTIAITPPISDEEFIRLSRVLTGIDRLEPDLAHEYLLRCAGNPAVQEQLKELVKALSSLKESAGDLEKGFHDKLKAEPEGSPFFAASEQIIYLWYIGAFFKPNATGGGSWDYGLPEHYFRGKVWPLVGTSPPMTGHALPQGQKHFDFWTKPATNGA